MLTIHDGGRRFDRRAFLTVGGLALGGLSLADLFAAQARAASDKQLVTGKSVIFLFLHGGPSQIETFDPKMSRPGRASAAPPARSPRGCPASPSAAPSRGWPPWPTSSTVVRSFVPGDGNHDIKPVVGRDTFGANLGSVYARMAGDQPRRHRHADQRGSCSRAPSTPARSRAPMTFGKFGDTGPFGAAYAPFDPSGGGRLQQDMHLTVPLDAPGRPPPAAGRARPRAAGRSPRRARFEGMDRVRAAGVRDHPRRRRRRLRPDQGGSAHRRALRHRAAGPAREHRQEVEELQQLRR